MTFCFRFGYADFATSEEATKALELTESDVDGRNVRIDLATPRGDFGSPRGGGGGRGRGRGGRGGTPGSGGRGRGFDEEPSNTLFVGNLSFSCSEDDLYEVFGDSAKVRIITDRETGKSKG